MIDPKDFQDIFGKTFVDQQEETVFELGRRKVSRLEASMLAGGKNRALGILQTALAEIGVESIAKLRKLDAAALGSIKGVGVTTLFAAMCLLDADGVDVRAWYGEDKPTFGAIKHREQRREQKVSRRRRGSGKVSRADGDGNLPSGK